MDFTGVNLSRLGWVPEDYDNKEPLNTEQGKIRLRSDIIPEIQVSSYTNIIFRGGGRDVMPIL